MQVQVTITIVFLFEHCLAQLGKALGKYLSN